MARLINRQIKVNLNGMNEIKSFRWAANWVPVSLILEVWKDTGSWWNGEAEKTFYRVETDEGSLYELYFDTGNNKWYLYRIYD